MPHVRSDCDGGGGFWEVNTASHVDFPQQSRIVEVVDNHDGTLSIFTTMLDHAGPASYGGRTGEPVSLAGLGRELALNDWQSRTRWPGGRPRGPQCRAAGRQAGRDALTPDRGGYSAAASCPQAPSISRPRVSRTVVGMPRASSRRTNSRSSRGSDAVHFDPGVGFSGIRLTCTQPQSP